MLKNDLNILISNSNVELWLGNRKYEI